MGFACKAVIYADLCVYLQLYTTLLFFQGRFFIAGRTLEEKE